MNILFFTSTSSSSGGARQALYLAQLLSEKHKVIFAVPKESTLALKDPSIHWFYLPESTNQWKKAFFKLAEEFQPEIIHCFHNKAFKRMAWWGLWLKKKMNVKCLAHRGVVFRPSNPLPYWSPGIDMITANSKACKKVLERCHVPSKKISLLYNCLPEKRIECTSSKDQVRNSFSIAKEKIIIGCIANNSPNKGADIFFQSLALIPSKNFHCICVGITPSKWETTLRKYGVEKNVTIIPWTENIADVLQIMDIFCIPSFSESMPNTLLEASHFRLPIVASNTGGIPEIVKNIGMLFKPGDYTQLAKNLQELIQNQDIREYYAANYAQLQGIFAPSTRLQKCLAIYQSLRIAQKKPAL